MEDNPNMVDNPNPIPDMTPKMVGAWRTTLNMVDNPNPSPDMTPKLNPNPNTYPNLI